MPNLSGLLVAHANVFIYAIIADMDSAAVAAGRYVVAVSGGVDSMVLLDVLAGQPDLKLVVAHYDHGIRSDSHEDYDLVERTAYRLGLQFYGERGQLGRHASEALARQKRYEFLYRVQAESGASAIITAHHQDDVLETAILNLIRGTGRRGLTSLASRDGLIRPLLHVAKQDVLVYAKSHGIEWREDSTNSDTKYLRNKVRLKVMPRLGFGGRQKLLGLIERQRRINHEIDELIGGLIDTHADELPRGVIAWQDFALACELMAAWLYAHDDIVYDRKLIERLVVAVKTLPPGKQVDVSSHYVLSVGLDSISLEKQPVYGKSSAASV